MSERDATMIAEVERRDKQWLARLDENARAGVIGKLLKIIADGTSKRREVTAASRVLAQFDRLDIERVRLSIEAAANDYRTVIQLENTGPVQINIAQQISELRKAAPTAEERRAMLDALDAGHGDNGNGNGNGNGHGSNGNGHH